MISAFTYISGYFSSSVRTSRRTSKIVSAMKIGFFRLRNRNICAFIRTVVHASLLWFHCRDWYKCDVIFVSFQDQSGTKAESRGWFFDVNKKSNSSIMLFQIVLLYSTSWNILKQESFHLLIIDRSNTDSNVRYSRELWTSFRWRDYYHCFDAFIFRKRVWYNVILQYCNVL